MIYEDEGAGIYRWCGRKKEVREKGNECPYKVGMQHSEEVGAGEELGAGGLEQQIEARPGTGLSHTVVPTQLCNTQTHDVRNIPKGSRTLQTTQNQNALQWEFYLEWRDACQAHPVAAHWLASPLVCCHWLLSCVCSDTWRCAHVWDNNRKES